MGRFSVPEFSAFLIDRMGSGGKIQTERVESITTAGQNGQLAGIFGPMLIPGVGEEKAAAKILGTIGCSGKTVANPRRTSNLVQQASELVRSRRPKNYFYVCIKVRVRCGLQRHDRFRRCYTGGCFWQNQEPFWEGRKVVTIGIRLRATVR